MAWLHSPLSETKLSQKHGVVHGCPSLLTKVVLWLLSSIFWHSGLSTWCAEARSKKRRSLKSFLLGVMFGVNKHGTEFVEFFKPTEKQFKPRAATKPWGFSYNRVHTTANISFSFVLSTTVHIYELFHIFIITKLSRGKRCIPKEATEIVQLVQFGDKIEVSPLPSFSDTNYGRICGCKH